MYTIHYECTLYTTMWQEILLDEMIAVEFFAGLKFLCNTKNYFKILLGGLH